MGPGAFWSSAVSFVMNAVLTWRENTVHWRKGMAAMTNLEKFIEVMNETFHARFTKENMKLRCSPCGALKLARYACDCFKCEGCKRWWDMEYKEDRHGYEENKDI